MEGHGNPCVEMLWISQENLAKSTTFPHKAIFMFSPNELKQHTVRILGIMGIFRMWSRIQ